MPYIPYSHDERKLSNGQLWRIWRIWKQTTLIELCSFLIDILAFELGKYARGGDFVSFFLSGGPSFALKAVPGVGILTEKISGLGVSPGGRDGNRSN